MAVIKNIAKVFTILILAVSLSGCAGTIVAGLTLSELLTAGSIGSTLITGKGLGEHAMDMATGKDCRIIEGVFRADRDICEEEGSGATKMISKVLLPFLRNSNRRPIGKMPNSPLPFSIRPKSSPGITTPTRVY